jgi:signal transduction histidine kinase
MATDRMHDPTHPHPRVPAWVGDAIAALIIVGAAFTPFPGHEYRPTSILAIAVMVAPALLLPCRRRWPIPTLAAVIVLYGVAAFTGSLSPGIVIAAAIAMFGVANRVTRKTTTVVAASAVAAVVLLSLLAATGSVFDPRAVQFAVTVAFAAAAGDAKKSRREYILAVTERAERAEQTRETEARRRVAEERLRIARDLHDAVAHQISVISLNAGVASTTLEERPEKAREALGTIRVAARTVLAEIGDLLEILRHDDESSDHPTAPQPGLDRLDGLVAQFADSGLSVHIRVEGDLSTITGAADLVAYRVIQEALTNAHKHGADDRAHVLIAVRTDRAQIVITNPVRPSDGTAGGDLDRTGGHGLLGLRERVASVRGTVSTGIVPGAYRVAVELPLLKERS